MVSTQAIDNKTYPRLNTSLNYTATDGSHVELAVSATIEAILLSIIIFAGILGNSLIVGVVLSKRLMRTRTNWFLVVLAINLVCLDMFCVPFRLVSILTVKWTFGDAVCKLSGFMNVFWFSSIVFTLVAISLHKYFSVVKPLKRIVTRRRAILMVTLVWLGAFACAIGPSLGWGDTAFLNIMSSVCEPRTFHDKFPTATYVVFFMSVACVIPVIIMAFLFWRIFQAVTLHCNRIRETAIIDVRGVLTQKQITTTLFIILTSVIVCWTPCFVYGVIMLVTSFSAMSFSGPLLRAAYICGFAQSVLNPVVLGLRNPRFRRGFKDIALCKWAGKAQELSVANGDIPGRTVWPSVDYLAEKRCSAWYLSTQQSLLSLEPEKPQRRLKLRWIETNL